MDWNYMDTAPVLRDEDIAGNFDWHTNLYQAAHVGCMTCLLLSYHQRLTPGAGHVANHLRLSSQPTTRVRHDAFQPGWYWCFEYLDLWRDDT